jgi:hypothetical protein
MAYSRQVIVNQAKAWLGKKESDGSHRVIIDTYNSHKPLARGYKMSYSSAWCSCFVSAVAIKCGYTAIIPTEVSCYYHIELFKKHGIWVENDAYVPSPGDLILYDWDDSGKGDNKSAPDHIGIVEKVANGKITVIEGNCSNAVMRRTLAVNGRYIRGYGVPKYDDEPIVVKPTEEPEKPYQPLKFKVGDSVVVNGSLYRSSNAASPSGSVKNRSTKITRIAIGAKHPYNTTGDLGWMDEASVKAATTAKSVDVLAREVIQGKWGNGAERKNRLTAAGYDYNAVQRRVNQLLS